MIEMMGCNLTLITLLKALIVFPQADQWRRRHSLCRATGMTINWQ
jgi:hypothetical protein